MLHAQSLEFSFRGEDYNFNIPAPFPELAKINRKIKTLE
jgi:hypothetical protein